MNPRHQKLANELFDNFDNESFANFDLRDYDFSSLTILKKEQIEKLDKNRQREYEKILEILKK